MKSLFKKHWPLLIIIFLGLIPLWWFRDGYLIAGGDNTIYINPPITFNNFNFSWLDKIDAGRPNLIKAIAFPFSFFWFYLTKLGFSLVNAQRFWFVLHFMLPGVTAYFLIRHIYDSSFKKGAIAALFGSLLYMFNPLVMMDAFSLGQRPLLIFFPLLLLFLTKGLSQEKFSLKYPALIALASLLYCTANINLSFVGPMYLGLFIYLFYFIFKTKRLKHALLFFFSTFILALLVNFWWLSDSFLGMLKSGNIITNIRSFHFMERTPINEAFRLMGSWAFRIDFNGMRNYPYSSKYYQFPVVFTTFFVPFFAFLSLLFNKNRKEKIFFAFLALTGIFLTKGIRFPFGGFYQYLYDNIPGFAIFREPFAKFSIIHLLAFSVLVGCFVEDFGDFLKRKFFAVRIPFCVILSLIIFSTGFPLLTGKNVQDENWYNDSRYSLFVDVPDYWKSTMKWFEENDPSSRVIIFPKTSYGQSYNWPLGIAVGDPVAEYLLPNPIIRTPMYTTFGQEILANIPYEAMKNDEKINLFPYLDLMSIKYVLQQNDTFPNETSGVLGPVRMKKILQGQKDLELVKTEGKLDIYEVKKDSFTPPIFQPKEIIYMMGGLVDLTDIFSRYNYEAGSLILFSESANLRPEEGAGVASKLLMPLRAGNLNGGEINFTFNVYRKGIYQILVDRRLNQLISKAQGEYYLSLDKRDFVLNYKNVDWEMIELGDLNEGVYTLSTNLPLVELLHDELNPKTPFWLMGDFTKQSIAPTANLSYQRINPSKYKIKVNNPNRPFMVVFNSTYNDDWNVSTKKGNLLSQHFVANGYSNGWYIVPQAFDENNYELTIEYFPQRIANLALIVSVVTVIFLFLSLAWFRKFYD